MRPGAAARQSVAFVQQVNRTRRPARRYASTERAAPRRGYAASPRKLLGLLALVGAVAFVFGCDPAPAALQRFKLAILISIDTLRADHLGIYGYSRAT